VKLAWNANPEPDIVGYRVHFGEVSGTYTEIIDVGNLTQARLENLPVGDTYFCAITAYGAYGLESPYSDEISFTVVLPTGDSDSDGDGLSDFFEANYSETGELEPDADLNGDGLPVLAEYAHGLDPRSPHNQAHIRLEPIAVDGQRYLSIRYLLDPAAEPFVSLHLERSLDLSDPDGWSRSGTTVVSAEALPDGSGRVEVVSRSLSPMSSQNQEFLRFAYDVALPPGDVDSDGDGLSDLFETHYSGTGELEPDADLNGDGLPVLAEYAHGLDPRSPHNRAYIRLEPILVSGQRYLSIRYLIDPAAEPFVTLHLERSINLSDPEGWSRSGTTVVGAGEVPDGSGRVEVVSRSLTPMSSQDREFLRFAYEATAP
jgi:hypothetical protein